MTLPKNTNRESPKVRLDRGRIIILAVFLILAVAGAVLTFRWAQWFFATTTVIGVGEAPPVQLNMPGSSSSSQNTPDPSGTSESDGSSGPATIEMAPAPKVWDGTSRVTLLVMGLDYRDWEEGKDVPRTDTMILFSLDPLTRSVGILSIPRDMWVNIPGFGYNRINTAYRSGEVYQLPGGGPALAAKTVENFIGVPVDYVALIDFFAFEKFIDELGGLDMHIRQEIIVDPIGPGNTVTLEPGVQTLDGATALAYARTRKTGQEDDQGDFDRSTRQQEVIMAMYTQITQFNQLPMLVGKAPKLYEELASGVHTNLTLDQVIQLAWLAVQVKEEDIHRGVFNPHTDVQYASVVTSEGRADVLVPNPDQIRILRDKIFATEDSIGPSSQVSDPAELVKSEAAKVVLRNGTQRADMLPVGGAFIRSLGVNIVAEEAADQLYANTTFVDHSGNPYTIKYLKEKLNVPDGRVKIDFNPGAPADLEVILGNDYVPQQ